jgi:hypothetical protein
VVVHLLQRRFLVLLEEGGEQVLPVGTGAGVFEVRE